MTRGTVRPPAVASTFYPGNPSALHTQIKRFLAAVPPSEGLPKALIAPHAGYIYSGPVAASAYKQLFLGKHHIKRVVLLGPCHRMPVLGVAAPATEFFETPFGQIPVDPQAIAQLKQQFGYVQTFDAAHKAEHSLEVHLPFLQEILEDFVLIPLVIGEASGMQVGAVLEKLWGGAETLIVVSSDLSHYHDYETAQRLDLETAEIIEQCKGEALDYESACGRNPIKGLLTIASKYQLRIQRVDLRNSGDTAGSKDRVVGYGSWIFTES